MQTSQLDNFLMIIECGSINKAAQRLFLAQSTLSQQLKQLEDEVGTNLFVREGKKLQLTPEGKVLAEYAEEQSNRLRKTLNRINAMKYGAKEDITIGLGQNSLIPDVGRWIGQLHKKHPEICCYFVGYTINQLIEMMNNKQVDVTFARQISSDKEFLDNFEYIEIKQHGVVAIVPPSIDFGDVEEISLKDIDGLNVILRNKHDKRFLLKCAQYDSVPVVKAQCRNNALKLALVKNNVGMGFFVDSILNSDAFIDSGLRFYRVKEIAMVNKTYIIYHKSKKDSEAIKNLVKAIFEVEG